MSTPTYSKCRVKKKLAYGSSRLVSRFIIMRFFVLLRHKQKLSLHQAHSFKKLPSNESENVPLIWSNYVKLLSDFKLSSIIGNASIIPLGIHALRERQKIEIYIRI